MELLFAAKEISNLTTDDLNMIADINRILLNIVWMDYILHKGEKV